MNEHGKKSLLEDEAGIPGRPGYLSRRKASTMYDEQQSLMLVAIVQQVRARGRTKR